MKIQYASDLHLEFRQNTEFLAVNPLKVVGDILVLAGDITYLGKPKFFRHPFFDWCSDNFSQTYMVPGNHEYYDGAEITASQTDFEESVRDNVRYINNKSVIHYETELFFSTLWSRISPTEIVPVQMGMTDFYRGIYDGRCFNAQDYTVLHEQSMEWLAKAINASTARNKVVVTHHCPTLRFQDPRFVGSTINSAFCVNLDRFIEDSGISHWIYGHTHYNGGNGAMIGNTVMHSNQLGYVKHGENETFQPEAVIEV